MPGQATGMASSATDFKMTVIEPNGITLVDNLKNAIKDYAGLDVVASAIFCLVIRFRGYDENGNLISCSYDNTIKVWTNQNLIYIKVWIYEI